MRLGCASLHNNDPKNRRMLRSCRNHGRRVFGEGDKIKACYKALVTILLLTKIVRIVLLSSKLNDEMSFPHRLSQPIQNLSLPLSESTKVSAVPLVYLANIQKLRMTTIHRHPRVKCRRTCESTITSHPSLFVPQIWDLKCEKCCHRHSRYYRIHELNVRSIMTNMLYIIIFCHLFVGSGV